MAVRVGMSKFGDWVKAGTILQAVSVNLYPSFIAKIDEAGELMLQKVLDHIDSQDLSWTPLADRTVELKRGDDTIYIETGWLRDNLGVRKIKSSATNYTIFVGASAWKRTPSGEKFSDLMIWLEYGTDRMPARPLIRPSWSEIELTVKDLFRDNLENLVTTGGLK